MKNLEYLLSHCFQMKLKVLQLLPFWAIRSLFNDNKTVAHYGIQERMEIKNRYEVESVTLQDVIKFQLINF